MKARTKKPSRSSRRRPAEAEAEASARDAPDPAPDPAPNPSGPPARTAAPDARIEPHPLAARSAFPIVGIGASAGGLEALEQFLRNVPEGSDAAFVIVQHQDPNRRGMLIELLQRTTQLQVLEARDGMRVEPQRVYVIPPGKDMSLLHGALHLLPQPSSPGRVLPIDFFFRSLAQDQGERSVGVILSGMGTDGTLGLRAIKEAAGVAFVQSPGSAKFDGMPRSAIDAGLADVVLPADELPQRILSYRDHATFAYRDGEARARDAQSEVDQICALLRDYSGNDFTVYKRSTIYRRIERRMGLHQLRDHAQYLRLLHEQPHEIEALFNELLIGVTSFFRDPAEWERLRHEIVPALVMQWTAGGVVRAWVPGCSTGEEAYSLAIVFREAFEPVKTLRSVSVQIFATDLDRQAIEKARVGLYPENIAADVSPEQLRRFFVHDERGYRVSNDIREMVVFAPQNALVDPPFTKVDVVSCRNLMIYLSADVQKRLIPLFHYCLNPGGVLFLGSAETVGSFTNLFAPLDGKTRLYRRLDQAVALPVEVQFSSFGRSTGHREERSNLPPPRQAPQDLQGLVERLLIQRYAPVGILCNTKGDVLYISGRAGKYLEPAVGKANLNLVAMARDGLRYELSRAFTAALRKDRSVSVRGIKVGTNGRTQHVNLSVQRLVDPRELSGTVLVVITDLDAPPSTPKQQAGARGPRNPQLEDELERAREQVQIIREEMQTSQEELKSSNEELQSTNEELQSTNEELTTSKEEMQSLNEELQTVNHELQSKVDELSRSNNDMKNLLNSTDIATLFLDSDLRVRRFTTATAQIIKLIPADVGRPVTDIASDLDYARLADDAREVLRTLMFQEKQAVTHDGRAFSVRILPYRTLDNVIDGVVITFTDTTAVRALERAAREQADQLRQMAESLPHLVFGARADGGFDVISRQWVDYTGVPDVQQLQWGWLDQVHTADRERVREEWRTSIRGGTRLDTELRIRSASGAYRWFTTRAVPIRDASGAVVRWYGSSTDIDQLKRAEDRLSGMLGSIGDGFLAVDKDLVVVAMNASAERMLGCHASDIVGHALFKAPAAVREIAQHFPQAPVDAELSLDGVHHLARIQRDPEGEYLVVLRVAG